MHIERFLHVSRAYLRTTLAIAPRRELDGPAQLWGHPGALPPEAVQRGTSVAALWTTSKRNTGTTSWPA
ncbi:hypothetical protein OKW34_002751 [Paraburkholderia youngii]